ncbi:uncharacterized protein LOC113561979 [Ooceraea biroi]|uniref:uncharacterized protein LOC113561979 n=1 Tax=Ooceraea biroi TaxID=2015173 RepID=UPI000F083A9F|nr:uncharacterized protein LOC113561979 [Ooceraea biroi]
MKIREGWSTAVWYAVCTLLCVHARPMRDRPDKMYIEDSRLFKTKSANGYGFEKEVSASKLSKIGESLEEFDEKSPSTMRAIITRARTHPVLLPLILEPEAEMLPFGYEGVKPPGVSHMELTLQKSQADSPSNRYESTRASTMDDDESASDQDDDPRYAASKYATQNNDWDSVAVFKAGSRKQRKKTEYREASGARKSHSRNENRARDDKENIARKKGTTYEARDGRRKAHNAAGYRGVYHEDEIEKDLHDKEWTL